MNTRPFFSRLCHSQIPRLTAITLVVLAWSSLAFCGEIHYAAAVGDLAEVKMLLKDNPDSTSDKNAPLDATEQLLSAAKSGDMETIKSLLKNGADINAKKSNGMTALMFAAAQGHADMVELLLDKGADINAEATNGWNALMFAEVMDMDQTNTSGLNASELLLEKDTGGINAALMYAVSADHTNAVKLLLDKGADINVKDKYDDTLLMKAVSAGHTNAVKLLLDKGADINAEDSVGYTALMMAAMAGQTDVVKLLLDKGADINVKGPVGYTALMCAASAAGVPGPLNLTTGLPEFFDRSLMDDDIKIAKLLLDKGADVNANNSIGPTALDVAKASGNLTLVLLLQKAGAISWSVNAVVASGTNTDSQGYVTNAALLTPFTLTNSSGKVVTNAVLEKLTPNKFNYKTPDGGWAMMRLDSLSKDLQEKFGYDPVKAAAQDAIEADAKMRAAQWQQSQRDLLQQQAGLRVKSQVAASDISRSIRAAAEKNWPNNYEMQRFEINQQTEAYNWVITASSATGVPQKVFDQIKSKAASEWPDNYEMQKFEINQQVKAYVELH